MLRDNVQLRQIAGPFKSRLLQRDSPYNLSVLATTDLETPAGDNRRGTAGTIC